MIGLIDPGLDIGAGAGYWEEDANKPFEIVGIIDLGFSSFTASCNGWNGEPNAYQTHYCDSIADATEWLKEHGCSRIINKVEA